MKLNLRYLIPGAVAIFLCACDSGEPAPETTTTPAPQVELTSEEDQALSQAAQKSWQLATPSAQKSAKGAVELLNAVEALLQDPSAPRLEAAQKQWHNLALNYQPLELYSQLAELQPEAFNQLHHLLYATGAYPIQPGYLDSFGPYQYSGVVHDISLALTPETLREQHGMTDAEDAALGLYAIEFLLFGTPGSERPAADFAPRTLTSELREQGFTSADELPRNRRRQLLLMQVRMLTDDLAQLAHRWPPQAQESLYEKLASQPTLERHLLLLRSARIELSRVLTALSERYPAETEQDSAPAVYSRPLPASLLEARVDYLEGLLEVLADGDELQQSLRTARQALGKVKGDEAGESTQAAVEALSRALEALTAELQRYAPEPEVVPSEPAGSAGSASPPAADGKTEP